MSWGQQLQKNAVFMRACMHAHTHNSEKVGRPCHPVCNGLEIAAAYQLHQELSPFRIQPTEPHLLVQFLGMLKNSFSLKDPHVTGTVIAMKIFREVMRTTKLSRS